ncbi:MAG: HNH endonuclease [Armatimonadetes bacterium]|nr:HNH endonuclease [Armatimonadota bacterium]
MNAFYPLVAARAEHRCEYCRAPEIIFNFRFEVEHIVPQASSGTSDLSNLALACRACNSFKSYFWSAADPETGTVVPLFHPRQDIWAEHFRFDPTSYQIQGITPIGRATVERLLLNADYQLEARSRWFLLDIFP